MSGCNVNPIWGRLTSGPVQFWAQLTPVQLNPHCTEDGSFHIVSTSASSIHLTEFRSGVHLPVLMRTSLRSCPRRMQPHTAPGISRLHKREQPHKRREVTGPRARTEVPEHCWAQPSPAQFDPHCMTRRALSAHCGGSVAANKANSQNPSRTTPRKRPYCTRQSRPESTVSASC